MRPYLRHFIAYMPAVCIAAGIAVLSLMEVAYVPAVELSDKWMHGIIYAILSASLMGGLVWDGHYSYSWEFGVLCITTAYGALMEILQHYCTYTRSGDIADLYADAIGALIGIVIVLLLKSQILNPK